MRWDVFCKVVDHHGDVGVAWRLAADLAARGESVRFHLDDRRALDWMAPDGATGVSVAGQLQNFDTFGQKMWQRTDDALFWERSGLIVRLELAAAREHEAQMKAAG